jgi:hypothetical protein
MNMAEVLARGVQLEVRTLKVTKLFLNQLRVLRSIPKELRMPPQLSPEKASRLQEIETKYIKEGATEEELREARDLVAEKNNSVGKLNPEYVVGWIHGSVLGEVYTKYILFVKDGDGFLYGWPGFKPEPWCKQLYIG